MVDVEYDYVQNRALVKDETKQITSLRVVKSLGGFIFYHVEVEKGKVPSELTGKFSSLQAGVKACAHYLEHRAKSQQLKRKTYRDGLEKRIEKKNAAKSNTESN